ncbi:hypothetical protein BHE74_00006383 [Ensete ventricosum]|nr:hypothetical protein BHE74_00006383 [Ensete ventricosum]
MCVKSSVSTSVGFGARVRLPDRESFLGQSAQRPPRGEDSRNDPFDDQVSALTEKGNSGPPKLSSRRMPGYYDMDDILMEDEVCDCTYALIEKGTKMDLPYWLAHQLHLRQAVSISVPASFSQKYGTFFA